MATYSPQSALFILPSQEDQGGLERQRYAQIFLRVTRNLQGGLNPLVVHNTRPEGPVAGYQYLIQGGSTRYLFRVAASP